MTTISTMLAIANGCGGGGGSGNLASDPGSDSGGTEGDSGVTHPDATTARDGATTTTDDAGRKCVTVDVASYSTACNNDSECVGINRGPICENGCACGVTDAVAKSELSRYSAAVSGIQTLACPCAAPDAARCVNQKCILCPRAGGGECGDQ